jgi:EAL domain-containing protein (putative c-di-GMP-specific phosphodiesterase class I)
MPIAKALSQDRLDRFVGFAFAAAELLVEMQANQVIGFAAGSFRERFGEDAEAFCGRDFSSLVAPEDQGGLRIALSLLSARGRITPVSLRLANVGRDAVSLSGLRLPDRSGVAWMTMSRLPAPPPAGGSLAAGPLFQDALKARLAVDQPCALGLVEVGGWDRLEPARRKEIEADIAAAMRELGGAGALAGEVGDGRFSVLGDEGLDMPELQARIGRILRAAGAGRPVAGTGIKMAPQGAGSADALRAMRFALTCFRLSGTQAVREAGFEGGLRGFLAKTEARAGAVRSALENGRFRLVFQPVVRLEDRQIHHFEALLRPFPLNGHGETSTQEFVTFAEAIGLAEQLDAAVLRRVIETLGGAKTQVAINISGISMQSASFRDMLLGAVEADKNLARRLMVELTETADIEDVPAAVDTVNRLGAAGVPMCLDDFGAGFAAFRYLKEFKVAFVKIDGSYVRQAKAGAREVGFVGAMVELARCVGAASIAEMVETEAQAEAMMTLGVQFGQGWLFGRPGGLPGAL